MKAAAEHLTPVLLELGGQNPVIVGETANLPDAARKIVWGAMAWGGQWCTSPGYAAVHESVAEAFVAECKKAVVDLYGGDPKNNSDYSRIINSSAVKRLASLIDTSKVVSGGNYDESACYLDPTILYPVFWSDKIMEDEIFGPACRSSLTPISGSCSRRSSRCPNRSRLCVQPESTGNRPGVVVPFVRRRSCE
jgi:aldehyde dehydrogenase (NAD+)